MVNRPSVPEIITVNSETLQTQIRDLLPSQNGFGSELQASNVITPIIDLTSTAEGSALPTYLQTALAFGSQTSFAVSNTTNVVANVAGFYRINGVVFINAAGTAQLELSDGSTQKVILKYAGATGAPSENVPYDVTIFLRSGDSAQWVVNATATALGSVRQVALGDGTLVQPNGFPL